MSIQDETGDFVFFVWDRRFLEELLKRHLGKAHLSCHTLFGAPGGDTRELVSGPQGRGFGEQRL
jgi:hypothetical protein